MKYQIHAKKSEVVDAGIKFVDIEMNFDMPDKNTSIKIIPTQKKVSKFNMIESSVFDVCRSVAEKSNDRERLLSLVSEVLASPLSYDPENLTDAILSLLKLRDPLARGRDVIDIFYEAIQNIPEGAFTCLPSKMKKTFVEEKEVETPVIKPKVKVSRKKKPVVLKGIAFDPVQKEIDKEVRQVADGYGERISGRFTTIDLTQTKTNLNIPL